jgi:hypothetical protein
MEALMEWAQKVMFLLAVTLLSGCVAGQSVEVAYEPTPAQAATKIYEDMRTISDAAERYALDNDGSLPQGTTVAVKKMLQEGGYLKTWPSSSGTYGTYEYRSGYDDMDGGSAADDALYTEEFTDVVCSEFMAKYASALGTLQSAQWDYAANGKTYPAVTLGKGARIFAIKWASADVDKCQIIWVMRYND